MTFKLGSRVLCDPSAIDPERDPLCHAAALDRVVANVSKPFPEDDGKIEIVFQGRTIYGCCVPPEALTHAGSGPAGDRPRDAHEPSSG